MVTRPDVKSEYYIDPVTGDRYVKSKLGGGADASGKDVGEVIIKDVAATGLPPQSTNIGVLTHTGSAQSITIPTGSTALVISGATNASDIKFGSTQAEAETITVGTGIPIKAAADKDSFKVPNGSTHLGYIGTNLDKMQYYWS